MRVALVLLALVAAAVAAPNKKPFTSGIEYDSFWTLDEINFFMQELEFNYPDLVEVETMGVTHEGRHILGVRITNIENLNRETLPVVFVTAGVSARDWMSVMTAVNIIHELVEHYEDENFHIVDNIEWFILPVANPDGYEFSMAEPANRAWIKNRNVIPDSDCIGINIERNFAFNWGLDISSSNDPCSSNFRGPRSDSEEETITIQFSVDITMRIQLAYLTIKSGSIAGHSMISFPFSSNNELFMPNYQERIGVGNIMTDAIWRNTGARYRTASEVNVNGFVSGTSGDYAAGQDNIPLVYTIFTPSGGNNGWDPLPSQINPVVDQIFFGVRALGEYVNGMPFDAPFETKH